ncbi:unnamed protein product [Closterium sp. Naga37s-1]|nr:unnamed protein product [Closterium sp. Naga37s-1]
MSKVHGSLARAGKVRGQTPKVEKQDKKKQPKGRAHKRMQYNRRFVTAGKHARACSTTAASSPPWWDSARSAALTRLRSKCCDAVCFRTLAPWHSTSKQQSMHIPVISPS